MSNWSDLPNSAFWEKPKEKKKKKKFGSLDESDTEDEDEGEAAPSQAVSAKPSQMSMGSATLDSLASATDLDRAPSMHSSRSYILLKSSVFEDIILCGSFSPRGSLRNMLYYDLLREFLFRYFCPKNTRM